MLHTPDGGYFLLDDHLHRLRAAAAALGVAGGGAGGAQLERRARDALDRCVAGRADASRVRLLVGASSGDVRAERVALPDVTAHPSLLLDDGALAAAPVRASASTRRPLRAYRPAPGEDDGAGVYAAARARVGAGAAAGVFDVLMHNEAGEVTECSIANVAMRDDARGVWLTPPADCGLLEGTARAELLRRGALEEAVIGVAQAAAAAREGRLVAFNAVRGVYRIELVEGASRL